MENTVEFQLPFSESNTRKALQINYKYIWSKATKKIKKTILPGIICVVLSTLTIIGNDQSGLNYIFTFFAIVALLQWILHIINYTVFKKKFNRNIENQINELKSLKNSNLFLSMNSESIIFKSELYDLRCIWSKTSYFIFEEAIFIDLKIGNSIVFIILEDEFTCEEEFNIIRRFIKEKSKEQIT